PALALHPLLVEADTFQIAAGRGPGEDAHRGALLHQRGQPGPVLENLIGASPEPRPHLDAAGTAMLRAQLPQVDGRVEQQHGAAALLRALETSRSRFPLAHHAASRPPLNASLKRALQAMS